MNAFESLVAMILDREGYWVKPNLKVVLTKAEKRAIGRPSSPRWEIDVVAYNPPRNQVLAVECKSFLDSKGVNIGSFVGASESEKSRYKLFHESKLRQVVFSRLRKQLKEQGSVRPNARVDLCLASGKIASSDDRQLLRSHFEQQGWLLFDDEWFREKVGNLSAAGYENEVAAIVSKILLRE